MNATGKTIVRGGIGFAGFLAFSSVTPGGIAYSNSFLSLFFGICCVAAYCYVSSYVSGHKKEEDRVGSILSLLMGIGLSFALTGGSQLERMESLQPGKIGFWLSWLFLAVFLTPFFYGGWIRLDEAVSQWQGWKDEAEEKRPGRRLPAFVKYQVLIFLAWLPVFLAFYPGAFVYDATDEYIQVATRTFTTHHPLAHVLMLGGFVAGGNRFFGSFNLGIAAYTLFQMLILSGVFSYTLLWLKERGIGRGVRTAILLFYGFFPVIPMYAVCSAKDGLFTAAFLVVVLQMLSLFKDPEGFLSKKKNIFAGILGAMGMMLLRNNGMYAYLVWIPVGVAGLIRITGKAGAVKKLRLWPRVSLLFLASVAAYLMISGGLARALKAESSAKQEIMTVPIQQMIRTYQYSPEVYDDEEKEMLAELFGKENLHLYNPRLSDLIKSKFNNEVFNKNPGRYLSLWIRNGLQAPMSYVNAWLMTSYGYWYPDAVINVYKGNQVHTFTYEDSSYFGFETEYPGTRESKFPLLEEVYRRLSLELYQQKVPALSMLFSPGFLFWVYAFFMGFYLWKREWSAVIPFLLILLLWLTAILGPTYLVRYVLILWFALPVIVSRVKL